MRFDPGDGNTPTRSTVKVGTLASPPENNPVREGFRFDGWTREGQPYDFQTPVLQDTTLKAKWSKATDWTLSPDHGPASGTRLTISPPSRILIVDSDGQAWIWNTGKTANVKPERIRQDQGMRIRQAQTLGQGFILLDANGQAYYLADGKTSLATTGLPENMKASRITTNKNQAVTAGTDGHIWTWKPGESPTRADNGSQPYTQAAITGGRITAISRQGSLYQWSINTQSQPDKPAKVNTTQAAILESASLDGQSLTLNKTDGSWQTEMPASQPGPVTITLTGRQDGKPFTRSFNYTVDQTLLKDIRQSSTYTVTFKTDGGSPKPGDQQVTYPYGRVQRPSPDATRSGYQFDGWFINEVAYDFSKPVTDNLTLTAKWTSKPPNTSWRISPDKGSQLGHETTTITPPDSTSGIRFSQVGGAKYYTYVFSLAVGSDGNAYARGDNTYSWLGDGTTTQRITPNIVRKPAGVPTDFTYVQVSAGKWHSLALGSDGYVYAWGSNQHGQLGNNTATNSSVPVRVRDPASPTDPNKGLKAIQVSAGDDHSLALDSNGYAYAWGENIYGQLGDGTTDDSNVPVSVLFNLQPVITAAKFDTGPGTNLAPVSNSNSITVLTPAHQPGAVTVSVDYAMGGAGQVLTDKSLTYLYLPAGVLPRAGGEGILLALATGMTGMGGVLASRRHRRERHRLLHTSHE